VKGCPPAETKETLPCPPTEWMYFVLCDPKNPASMASPLVLKDGSMDSTKIPASPTVLGKLPEDWFEVTSDQSWFILDEALSER
jgi:hypothetical protein